MDMNARPSLPPRVHRLLSIWGRAAGIAAETKIRQALAAGNAEAAERWRQVRAALPQPAADLGTT